MTRRAAALCLILMVSAALAAPALAHSHHGWRVRTLRFESSDGHAGYNSKELHRLAYVTARRFHPIGNWRTVKCIIDRESGWYPQAQNPTSSAYGLLQIVDGTWASWYGRFAHARAQYGVTWDRGDPRNSLIIGLQAMHESLAPWGGYCG